MKDGDIIIQDFPDVTINGVRIEHDEIGYTEQENPMQRLYHLPNRSGTYRVWNNSEYNMIISVIGTNRAHYMPAYSGMMPHYLEFVNE